MRLKALAAAAFLLAGFALMPLGAEQVLLDVDSAVQKARANNLSLRSARIDLGIKQRARATSWNRYLPSLAGETSLERRQTVTSGGPTDPSPWDLSANFSTSLRLSAAGAYDVRAAELEYGAGAIALEQADKQLERDVRKAFYDLLLRHENIRLLEQSLETARKRYEQISANYEYGLVSELDKLNAQVSVENLKPDLAKARTDRQSAALQLKQKLGLDRGVELVLQGSIEASGVSLDAEQLIRDHASGRLAVQALVRELSLLENERKLTAAEEFGPVVSLSYSYRIRQSDPFAGSAWLGPGWSGTSILGISLSVPLDGAIPSSASRVKLAVVDDGIRKANLELTQARQEGEITVESLVANLERSRLGIQVLKKNVELASRVYELTNQEYEAGLTDLLTLEESYDDLQRARLKVLTEQYNYRALLLDLEYELNASLGT